MERDPAEAEIRRLLRQPMGRVARGVAFGWLHRYATDALAAAREGATRRDRADRVRAVTVRLLQDLRGVLPLIISRENVCEAAVREARERARRAYRERFEREVMVTLADPAFSRPAAERVASAEFYTFRRELDRKLAALVAAHRGRMWEAVIRLMDGG